MYNFDKLFSSKPIYSTCFSCLSVFKSVKISTGKNAIEESVIDLSSCLTNSFDLEVSTLLSKFVERILENKRKSKFTHFNI